MATNSFYIKSGILNIKPKASPPANSVAGDLYVNSASSNRWEFFNGSVYIQLADISSTQTFTGKTIDGDDNTVQDLALTSFKTNVSDASKFLQRDGSGVVISSSKTVPTGSVVGTTDTQVLTGKTIDGDDNTVQDLPITALKTNLTDASKFMVRDASGVPTSATKAVPTGAVVGTTDTQVLSGKTIDGDDNTVQDLPITALKTNLTDASKFMVRDASGVPTSATKAVPTGAVVGTTDAQVLTTKTITAPIFNTYTEVTEQVSAPATPASGTVRVYALSSDKLLRQKDSTGLETVFGVGAGSIVRSNLAAGAVSTDAISAKTAGFTTDALTDAYYITPAATMAVTLHTGTNGERKRFVRTSTDLTKNVTFTGTISGATDWAMPTEGCFDIEWFGTEWKKVNYACDTDWITYTPTFTSFGTVSTQSFRWRKHGPDILIDGTWAAGTVTGSEARVSIPVTSDTFTTIRYAGQIAHSGTFAGHVLIESATAYLTFSLISGGGLSKATGGNTMPSSGTAALQARLRVAGWKQ